MQWNLRISHKLPVYNGDVTEMTEAPVACGYKFRKLAWQHIQIWPQSRAIQVNIALQHIQPWWKSNKNINGGSLMGLYCSLQVYSFGFVAPLPSDVIAGAFFQLPDTNNLVCHHWTGCMSAHREQDSSCFLPCLIHCWFVGLPSKCHTTYL